MEMKWTNRDEEIVYNLATLCKSDASCLSIPLLASIPHHPKKKRTFRVDMGWVNKPMTFDQEKGVDNELSTMMKGATTCKNSFDNEQEGLIIKLKLSTNIDDPDYVPEKESKINSNNSDNVKNKKRDFNDDDNEPNPPPRMPERFRTRISELVDASRVISKEKLVVQRKLEDSDCNGGQNRFNIPKGKLHEEFLEEHEKSKKIQRVNIIDPSFKHYRIELSKWNQNRPYYVLNGKTWRKIKIRNGLLPGMMMQLWAIRVDDELWFVLVNLTPPSHLLRN
ncbi:hypothetical protein LIER_24214 [Lithospermum erythrorhizon]|uniref:B3 domain-containing protein n=1 Tax=Lithospermum erythrorhizon TaxID=34254 RepID=A0AAV3R4J3_LITER